MSSETQTERYAILDSNVAVGYVTLIVDIWDGELNDPATTINRYVGVWPEEALTTGDEQESFNPDFSKMKQGRYSYGGGITPVPSVWEKLENIRAGDPEAKEAKREDEGMRPESDGYMPYQKRQAATLYQAFMDAVEILAEDRENAEAWGAVDAWRQYSAHKHER